MAEDITVCFLPDIHERLVALATSEHLSPAAYLERLVGRDLRERAESNPIVRVYVAHGLPDVPKGEVIREEDETEERHAHRSAILGKIFGAR